MEYEGYKFYMTKAGDAYNVQNDLPEKCRDNAKLEGDLRDLQAKLAQLPPPTDAGVHCVSRCADCTVLCRAFA